MAQTDDWLDSILLGLHDWGLTKGSFGIEPIVAKKAIRKHMAAERIDELKQLAAFLKSAHLYDQDSAMKIRWHFDKRIAALEQREEGENNE